MTETDKDSHHTKKRKAAASGLSAFLPQYFCHCQQDMGL